MTAVWSAAWGALKWAARNWQMIVVAGAVFWSYQHGARTERAKWTVAWEARNARDAELAKKVAAEFLRNERHWMGAVQAAERQSHDDAIRAAAARRSLAVERDGLRDEVRMLLGRTTEGDATLTACRNAAATLGDVLRDVEEAGERMAGAAEVHAADVRKLMSAWPTLPP